MLTWLMLFSLGEEPVSVVEQLTARLAVGIEASRSNVFSEQEGIFSTMAKAYQRSEALWPVETEPCYSLVASNRPSCG